MAFTLNDLIEMAKKGGKAVADKAGELTEQTKVAAQLLNERAELDTLYKELGRIVYFAAKNNDRETDFEDSFAKIDVKCEKIAELEQKANELKGCKICGVCGKKNSEDSEYCSACGNKL